MEPSDVGTAIKNSGEILSTLLRLQQKVNYILNDPIEAGFVNHPQEWRLSSANEQSPIKIAERI